MFFKNLLKNIRKRQAAMAPPIRGRGGFLRNLMLKNRNRRNMLMPFMGGKFNMPLFGRRQGIMSLMSPASYDRDVNDLPIPQAGASLDIMPQFGTLPKQPPQVGTAPQMSRGNASLLPTDIAPLPPKPMMGINMGMPNFMSSGQMPKTVVGMKDGGDMDAEEMNKEYPNKGLAALAASGPGGRKAVKAMGFANGMEVVANPIPGIDMPSSSDADMMNYQNTLMAIRELKASLSPVQQQYFDSAVQEILGESGRTISNQDREILKKKIGFDGGMSDMQKRKLARLRSLAGGAGLGPGALKVPTSLRVD